MSYWLMKSEPEAFSIDDLHVRPNQIEPWDGVRNYQARNFMRDDMQIGDQVFFYHSNCEVPGIVGIMAVASKSYPDASAFDPQSKYFDVKSSPAQPRWFLIDVKYVRHTRRTIALAELKEHEFLENMQLLRKGNRLSIMPVTKEEWDYILRLE
jgi:predicted RNA-binding protein with PUA-like domain